MGIGGQMKNRNLDIDILRLFFAVIVMFHHAKCKNFEFPGGYLSVEFFFIISGFFMAEYIGKKQKNSIENSYELQTNYYLYKKIVKLFPYYFLSTIIGWIVKASALCGDLSVNELLKSLFTTFPKLLGDFLFLQLFGFPVISGTGTMWFLCALFLSLIVVYPLTKYAFKKTEIFFYFPVLSLLIWGLIIRKFNTLNVIMEWTNDFFNIGILRGIAGLLLGVFIYTESCSFTVIFPLQKRHNCLIRFIEKIRTNKCFVVKISLLLCIFFYMRFDISKYQKYDGICILLIACLIYVNVNSQNVLPEKAEKIALFCNKIAMALFMNHYYWVVSGQAVLTKLLHVDSIKAKIVGCILSILTSLFVVFSIDCFRKKRISEK